MKKLLILLAIAAILGFGSNIAAAGSPFEGCVAIKDGELTYSAGHYLQGEPLMPGYDPYGYNYQAHMFNGSYANAYLGRYGFPPYEGDDEAYLAENPDAENTWVWPYRNVQLMMQWNDAWLSNKDCPTTDGQLDRYYGYPSYIGSGAWLTNHQSESYDNGDGRECQWLYFVKIVAAPGDATDVGGIWYAADGTEIGPVIWDSFAVVQRIYNDPCAGDHGVEYLSPVGPGFGKF
jgi:hypothetical protein